MLQEKNCLGDDLKHIKIALMGVTGSGKSTFIKTATQDPNVQIGENLGSCTADVQDFDFIHDGYKITLVDTPGFNDSTRTEAKILKELANYLGEKFRGNILLTGIIYVHALERRMMGSSLRNLKMFRELCGPEAFRNVLIVTTGWTDAIKAGKYDKAVAHEKELKDDSRYFAPLIAKGATMARFEDTRESALSLIKRLVGFDEVMLKLQKELILENKPLSESSAGAVVNEELRKLDEHYKTEMNKLKEEIEAARKARDGELEEALAMTQEAFEEQLRRISSQKDQLLYQRREDQRKHDQEMKNFRKEMEGMKRSHETEKMELQEIIDMVRKNQDKLRPEEREAVNRELDSTPKDGKTMELLISIFNMVGSVSMTVLGLGEMWESYAVYEAFEELYL